MKVSKKFRNFKPLKKYKRLKLKESTLSKLCLKINYSIINHLKVKQFKSFLPLVPKLNGRNQT